MFKMTVSLQNTSLTLPSLDLMITFQYDHTLYKISKSLIQVSHNVLDFSHPTDCIILLPPILKSCLLKNIKSKISFYLKLRPWVIYFTCIIKCSDYNYTLENHYNTTVGSHRKDLCYKWNRVITNGMVMPNVLVKYNWKWCFKCSESVMHTNQRGNVLPSYYLMYIFKTLRLSMWYFKTLEAKV